MFKEMLELKVWNRKLKWGPYNPSFGRLREGERSKKSAAGSQ